MYTYGDCIANISQNSLLLWNNGIDSIHGSKADAELL